MRPAAPGRLDRTIDITPSLEAILVSEDTPESMRAVLAEDPDTPDLAHLGTETTGTTETMPTTTEDTGTETMTEIIVEATPVNVTLTAAAAPDIEVRAARIIEDRNTGRSKGVGYVEFYDEESVIKAIALTGQKILGIPVIAKHTESEKNRLALQAASQTQEATAEKPVQGGAADIAQHRLYIGSVNFDLTEDDLKQVLEPFGAIEFVKLHRDPETGKSKGFAFVQYQKAEDAKQALSRLNGYELAGRTIKVGMVTEKGSHSQSNGVQQQYNGSIDHSISIDDSDTAGYAMTNLSRAELMQKLARGDVNLGAIPTPPGSTTGAPAAAPAFVPPRQMPVVMPSRSVLLKNMFTEEDKTEPDWAKELEEDVKEEAEKSGAVVHIHVEQESVGEIYLKFDSVQSATNAVQSLGGRFFAGRQIIAAYLPEMLYNVRFPRAANL
ncbi:hypothetical protein BG006_011125 [Podila minutissima]|uniref:RRM domain-containing protein n=1 Tax=Podila minutissima TaxID=64525 RepID=A0A9P5SF59_9FUNG|nr:hypothetical protein BG006_011125 [Podila minutissima]